MGRVVVLQRAGRRFQPAEKSKPFDHYPVVAAFSHVLHFANSQPQSEQFWYGALSVCLLEAYKRERKPYLP